MEEKYVELLKTKCSKESYEKLIKLDNPKLHNFIAKYTQLCNPDSVFIGNDSAKDRQYIRNQALKNGEEKKLAIKGHTIHFDGYNDQARDRAM